MRKHTQRIANTSAVNDSPSPQVYGFPVEFILLSPNVGHYMNNNFDACVQSLENNSKYIRLKTFQYLIVYKRSIN